MKPNLKHIFICIFVTLSIGCTNNNSFNIQGELNINNQNLTFINNELNNILLRRDDVFIIKNNSISLGYSNINDNKYFLEDENNKIKVLNEGKYNIKIIDNKLYFTKIDSSFSNIELHISDEENYQFIKNDDFTFSLNNVFIDETNFSIISDNYIFNFDINNQDFVKNNNYYKPLKMGYYSFKIDYSLLNPLHASLNSEIGTSSLFNPNFSIAFFSVGIPCVSNPGMNGVSNPFKFLYLTIVSFKILFKACPM